MSFVIMDCLRCQSPLTLKESRAKEHYCEPCRKIAEANAHREQLASQIHRANRVMR